MAGEAKRHFAPPTRSGHVYCKNSSVLTIQEVHAHNTFTLLQSCFCPSLFDASVLWHRSLHVKNVSRPVESLEIFLNNFRGTGLIGVRKYRNGPNGGTSWEMWERR